MRQAKQITMEYDVVVVGGGLSGVCAALAAARTGAKTAIVQARSVYGGNSSSEVRMHIAGATCHFGKEHYGETGILMELLLENKRRNPYHSFSIWDAVLWEKIRFQAGLDGYLNTTMEEVRMQGDRICSIVCRQMTTESEYHFRAPIFVDATGNGMLGYFAGAVFRYGSEGRGEFGEPDAPQEPNTNTMGNTVMFIARDMGEPVPFEKPHWAYTFDEEDLAFRGHGNTTMYHGENGITEEYCAESGYWWVELGGDTGDIIGKAEWIRDELYRVVYGIWDHIKNRGDHGAANYALQWVGSVPGIRESRRLQGDYLLNENDVLMGRVFTDAVAYGGWPMDEHAPKGVFDRQRPTRFINFPGIYSIPYRCYYACNIRNLMMAGRNISTTKMAYGSTRVMATCAVGGQAVGTAAALAVRYGCEPRAIGSRIGELQQLLLKDDCYIPGVKNEDPDDFARGAHASAGSALPGAGPENVLSGVTRIISDTAGSNLNMWASEALGDAGQTLRLDLQAPETLRRIHLVFDPNLSQEIMPSMTRTVQERQPKSMPPELVKAYAIRLYEAGTLVHEQAVDSNHLRLNIISLPGPLRADRVDVQVRSTWGLDSAHIFEVRLY